MIPAKIGFSNDFRLFTATVILFSVSAWHTRGRAPSATFVFNHFTDIKRVGTELIWISYQRSRKSLSSTLVLHTNFLFLCMMFVFQLAKRLILMHKIRTKDYEQVETWEDRLGRELNSVQGTGLLLNSKYVASFKVFVLWQSTNTKCVLQEINGILLPKLFWPTVRKKCSSDRENRLKFKAEGQEFAKILRSLEQLIWTLKCQYNFWNKMLFFKCSWRFLRFNILEQL